MAQATLVVSGLTKSYGDLRAVDDLSFDVAPGETFGLLGPNGAGKTTSILMICGLLSSDAGSVQVQGITIRPGSTAGRSSSATSPSSWPSIPTSAAGTT